MRERDRRKRWLLRRWNTVRDSKRREPKDLFAADRRAFEAYVLREQLDRLWTYQTRASVLKFLLGWIQALRWQRLPKMERLGRFLVTDLDGIAAYCDHCVRFGVVESVNTTIKAVLRRARSTRPDDAAPEAQVGDRYTDPLHSEVDELHTLQLAYSVR